MCLIYLIYLNLILWHSIYFILLTTFLFHGFILIKLAPGIRIELPVISGYKVHDDAKALLQRHPHKPNQRQR